MVLLSNLFPFVLLFSAAIAAPVGNIDARAIAISTHGDAGASIVAPPPILADRATAKSSFQLQNGKDAQALNAKFAKLTASSSCTSGQQACVGGKFAQCVGGKFVTTSCSAGTKCFALPLVNKPGTSIACDTQADAIARIAATSATGGITG